MKPILKISAVLPVMALGLALAAPTQAEEPTPGREYSNPFTTVRLLNAGKTGDVWTSGLHIQMQADWKTYWHVPGAGGVPPHFDWSGSKNLASANVLLPLPKRFHDENGEGIGYKKEVVFHIDMKPQDPSKPVLADLKLFYAVCNDICVPVEANLKYEIAPSTQSMSDKFRLKVARTDVPVNASERGIDITSIKQVDYGEKGALELRVSGLKNQPEQVDMFVQVEGPAYFRKPELVSADGKDTVWRMIIDSYGPKPDLAGKKVKLTIADGESGLVHDGVLQ